MSTSKSYFIEMLDNGFVLKEGNSKTAIEANRKVMDTIIATLVEAMSAINTAGTNNMVVNISVDVNVPQILPR